MRRRFQNDKTTYGLYRPNDFRPAESVCPCGAGGYGNARRYRRYCLTTGSKIWYDRAFPLYHTDARLSNSSLAHSIKGVTFCPASFLLSPSIRRYVWFLEENQKKYARNERNVYFSTFTMYLCQSNNAETPDANLHSNALIGKMPPNILGIVFLTPLPYVVKGRPSRSVHAGNYTDLNHMRSSFSRGIHQMGKNQQHYGQIIA